MFPNFKFSILIYFLYIQTACLAQDSPLLNYNEGGIPSAKFFIIEKDTLIPLTHLIKSETSTVLVLIQGGMENVLYNQVLTSKDAVIEKSNEERNVYYITPLNTQYCELIVDVKLMEVYYQVVFERQGKRQYKKIIQTYVPKTYMIGYSTVEVIE
jgi:hypothetical protein